MMATVQSSDDMRIHTARGFTLFEVLITIMFVLALFQLISVFGVQAIYVQEIDQARETIRNELVFARDQAMVSSRDESWGVLFTTTTIIQYKGSSYASRDTEFDRVNDFGSRITITGDSEIIFNPPYGEAQASGTINVTNGTQTAIITINPYGTIEVQ
jgi:Tfp pilus assembly protein FimT